MNQRIRMLGVWSGILYFLLWGTGLVTFVNGVSPMSGSLDAQTVAAFYQERTVPILVGVVIMTVTATFYLPWTLLLSDLMKAVEAPGYLLSQAQIIGGALSFLTFWIPPYFWGAAAYRPLRNIELTQALNDIGWLIFITGIGPFILQYVSLAVMIFIDKRENPPFPRWAGYLQIWISLSFIPAVMPFFMKTGPFSMNGLFVWWIPLTLFIAWFVMMITLARKAVLRSATA